MRTSRFTEEQIIGVLGGGIAEVRGLAAAGHRGVDVLLLAAAHVGERAVE